MKKYLLGMSLLLIALNSVGQFIKKDSVKLSGDDITFVAFANIDSDSLMEAVSLIKKGSLSYLYASKFSLVKADTTLLADSISTTSSPVLLDWNGDNQLDFAFTTSGPKNTLLLLNQGNLKFTKLSISIGNSPLSKIQFTELTNDETREVITSKISGGWSIYKESGGNYSPAIDSAYSVTDFYTFDFDSNGYNDIALSGLDNLGKPYLKIIEFEDSLRVTRIVKIANPINGEIESADLNYDGLFDLFISGKNGQGQLKAQSFINHDSTFIAGNSYPALLEQSSTLADFDSDGKVDLASIGKDNGNSLFHWLKTASGDSISLPVTNITHHAFGDYDRDGDLDLLLSTDTLGLIVFENAALKNLPSSKPTNEVSAFIYNRLFLYWDKSSDVLTPQPSLTYDLILNKSGNEIIDGEFESVGGLRLSSTNGNLGTNNFLLKRVSAGTYDYKIEAVDNAFFSKKIKGGVCNGNCTLQQPKTITSCNNKPVEISAQQPVLWFSFAKGYLGKSSSIKAPSKTDTIFSFLPQPSSSGCNNITVYLLKELKEDTIRVAQNFIGCEGASLEFIVASEWNNVTWKDNQGNSKGSGNTLAYTISKNETVTGIGSNSNGCFIKQKENIKLSKPELVLDGTDYRIQYGSSVTLGVSGAQDYQWAPATGLNDATSSNPIASPIKTTTYTVTGFDSLQCTSKAQLTVEVFFGAFVPNLFTPNGDGKNDELKIYGLSGAQDFHFSVYNREGSVVYESSDWSSVNWDGTKSGTQQPTGLYYWKVQGSFHNGQPLRLNEKTNGSILLVR